MYNDKRYRYAKTRNMVMTDEGETPDPAAPAAPEPEKSDGDSCEAVYKITPNPCEWIHFY